MSYAMLLEDYDAEQEIANASYAGIAEAMTSLVEFVNQDITIDFSVSLENANSDEALKEASIEGLKAAAVKIKDKLIEWAKKIVEQVKKVAQKAAIAAANQGNKALKKLISDKATTKKDLILKKGELDKGQTKAVIDKLSKIATIEVGDGSVSDSSRARVAAAVEDAFKNVNDYKSVDVEEKAGQSAKVLYDLYVDNYINKIDYKGISSTIDKTAKNAVKLAKHIEAGKVEGGNAEGIRSTAKTLMQAGTTLVGFAFQNVSIGVANAAKIALACGARKEKEEKAEEK